MKPPRHLWIVGLSSLLWNAFGAADFLMTNIRDQAWLAQLPAQVVQQIDAYPGWSIVAWGAGTWGALAGSLLLLLRLRLAVWAFALSLAGLAVTTIYQVDAGIYGLSGAMLAMNLAIWAGAIGLLVYARRMKRFLR